MASKICAVCAKKTSLNWTLVKLRGKYNPTQKVRKYPNLQWARIKGERILACAKCIKAQAKV